MTFAIYFGMLLLVAVLVLRRPSVALGAFMCTYGLEQWAQSRDSFFFVNASLTNILTAMVLVWGLVVRQFKGESIFSGGFPKVFWVIAALFAWSAFSLFWTPDFPHAASIWKGGMPYLVATIIIMPLLVRDLDDLKAAFQMTMLLGGVVLLLLMFDSAWVGRQIVLRQGSGIGSVISDRGSPLSTAALAGWVTLIALLMNYRGAGRFWQLVRWPLILLGLIVAFRSGSRGQLFAMVIAGIMFLPFSRRIKNIGGFLGTVLGIVLILVLATWAFDMYAYNASTRWNPEKLVKSYTEGRYNPSSEMLATWAEAGPVTWVIGLGSSSSYDIVGFYPHLVMAEVLAELGIVGFILLWAVVIVGYTPYVRLHNAVKDDPVRRGLAAAIAALFMFEIILSFKQGSLLGSAFAFGFAVVLGRLATAALSVGAWSSGAQAAALDEYGPYYADPRDPAVQAYAGTL